jgi:uncharacterized membrane protein YphA (DoxX/SURF4 family)
MRTIFTWTYTVLLMFAFIGAGAAKLAAQPVMVEQFESFGYPLWSMYVTGAIEFVCAILVLVPRFAHIGAGVLACVMAGAIYSHLAHGQASMLVPPVLLFILALTVGTLRGWGRGVLRRSKAAPV